MRRGGGEGEREDKEGRERERGQEGVGDFISFCKDTTAGNLG